MHEHRRPEPYDEAEAEGSDQDARDETPDKVYGTHFVFMWLACLRDIGVLLFTVDYLGDEIENIFKKEEVGGGGSYRCSTILI